MNAAIVGGTGYAGQQLISLIHSHKCMNIHSVFSHSLSGNLFSLEYGKFSGLAGKWDTMSDMTCLHEALISCDIAFFALPHGESAAPIQAIMDDCRLNHLKIVDLGSDFRFSPLYPSAVYGLCETNKEAIKTARLVANPGCYPTAATLALSPLIQKRDFLSKQGIELLLERGPLIIDAKSGLSGAGRGLKSDLHFAEAYGNAYPYKIGEHSHTLEIEAALGLDSPIQFTPNIIPVNRGIIENIYIPVQTSLNSLSAEHLLAELYSDYYRQSCFIRIRQNRLPKLTDVTYTNQCDIGFKLDERTGMLVVVSAIDNLMKGAAGQAVQNMNLMFGFEETEGLLYHPGHL